MNLSTTPHQPAPAAPSSSPQQVQLVVAGVAGGVGTTTVAAALARALASAIPGQVGLQDHDGGTLFARAGVWEGDRHWSTPEQAPVRVQCLGRASNVLTRIPTSVPGMVPLIVAPWHEDGLRLAAGVMQSATTVEPMMLLCDVTQARAGQSAQVRAYTGLAYDRALAAPGPLRDAQAAAEVERTITQVAHEALRRATQATNGLA